MTFYDKNSKGHALIGEGKKDDQKEIEMVQLTKLLDETKSGFLSLHTEKQILTESKTMEVLKVFVITVLICKVLWEKLKTKNFQGYHLLFDVIKYFVRDDLLLGP